MSTKAEEFRAFAKRITPGEWGHNAEDGVHSKVQTPEGVKIATTYGDDASGYRAMYNAVFLAWCGREKALIAEALTFLERKNELRDVLSQLELSANSNVQAVIGDALAILDRRVTT